MSTPAEADPRVAYQIGFLKGRNFTDEQIDQFAALMATEPSVRPGPRSQRPRHVPRRRFDYPTDQTSGSQL